MIIAYYGYLSGQLLLSYPHAWPDEPLFAEPALGLLRGSFGTPSMAGTLPGIEDHTLWMPPLYFGYLALWFAVLGPDLATMRCGSSLMAAITIGIVLWIGRRIWKWSTPAILVALVVFTTDHVWLRGSLVGRMDMLTLATTWFGIAALLYVRGERDNCSIGNMSGIGRAVFDGTLHDSEPMRGRQSVLLGGLAGVPVLVHPAGVIAPLTVGTGLLLLSRGTIRRHLLHVSVFSIGGLIVGLPWLAYAATHATDFCAQLSAQVGRKAAKHGLVDLAFAFDVNAHQYEMAASLPAAMWTIGCIGLCCAAVRSAAGRVLFIAHALSLTLMIYGCEMWYPIFAVPGTALGTGWLVHNASRSWLAFRSGSGDAEHRRPRPSTVWECVGGGVAVVVLTAFAWANVDFLRRLDTSQGTFAAAGSSYRAWCREFSRHLPPHSVVYICACPDPYFGLWLRDDLTLLEFLPAGLPHSADDFQRRLSNVDVVIVTEQLPDARILPYLQAEFVPVARVGKKDGSGYVGFVCRRPSKESGL